MGEMLGSRPMTGAERVRRHRSLRALRRAAEDEALSAEFGDREVSVRLCDFVLTGLTCENEQAVRTLAVFLAGLPAELAELRRALDEIRQAAHPR